MQQRQRATKKEFIAKGDAICKRLTTDTDKVKEPTDKNGIDEYLGKILKLADSSRADFAKLDPPKDGGNVKKALLDAFDATLAKAREAKAAAAKGDTAAMQKALQDAGKAGTKSDMAADAYGFKECGTSS